MYYRAFSFHSSQWSLFLEIFETNSGILLRSICFVGIKRAIYYSRRISFVFGFNINKTYVLL